MDLVDLARVVLDLVDLARKAMDLVNKVMVKINQVEGKPKFIPSYNKMLRQLNSGIRYTSSLLLQFTCSDR